MGREANRQKKIQEYENKLVTRGHMADYVAQALRGELAAYHRHLLPLWEWWERREARWYRRLWRKLLSIFQRGDRGTPPKT